VGEEMASNSKEYMRNYMREYCKKNPEKCRKYDLKSKKKRRRSGFVFTIPEAEMRATTKECEICGKIPRKELCVDHCHDTGLVRGLLCYSCNFALGLLKDNVALLQKASVYLERTKSLDLGGSDCYNRIEEGKFV
jgi:hypothetical protein